jgi:hypothetical protein
VSILHKLLKVALNTKNQSIKSNIATKGNVNDQFSSFLDRKQTNYLPNAKGKKKTLEHIYDRK